MAPFALNDRCALQGSPYHCYVHASMWVPPTDSHSLSNNTLITTITRQLPPTHSQLHSLYCHAHLWVMWLSPIKGLSYYTSPVSGGRFPTWGCDASISPGMANRQTVYVAQSSAKRLMMFVNSVIAQDNVYNMLRLLRLCSSV